MQLAGYLLGCIKRQCAQHCRAAWCALGINSLSCVCFSLIITYRTQWLVYLESNGEGCHARHTPVNSHIDLCLYTEDEMWHLWPSLSLCQSVSLFTYHNSTTLHLLNAIHISWCYCFLKHTEHKLKWSRASITCSKEKKHFLQWQNKPWEPHRSTNHLAVNAISTNSLGSPHWSPVLLSDPVLKKTLYPCVRHFKGG